MVDPPGQTSSADDLEPAPETGSDVDRRLRSAQLFADVQLLREQVALSWAREAEVLSRLGLTDGMDVLDLGCGPGFVTEELLRAFPASRVVAVDLDAAMASHTAARLGPDAPDRLTVLTSSAINLDLDDECLDFALARLLFQHLASPELAVREVHRLLRPGGAFAIIDIDDAVGGIVDPPIPSLATFSTKVAQLQANRGGNRYVGRLLWRLLQQAGFESLAVTPILLHSDDLGIDPFLAQLHPNRYRQFIAAGGLTSQEWDTFREDFERFAAAPKRYIAHLLLVVSGRKG